MKNINVTNDYSPLFAPKLVLECNQTPIGLGSKTNRTQTDARIDAELLLNTNKKGCKPKHTAQMPPDLTDIEA